MRQFRKKRVHNNLAALVHISGPSVRKNLRQLALELRPVIELRSNHDLSRPVDIAPAAPAVVNSHSRQTVAEIAGPLVLQVENLFTLRINIPVRPLVSDRRKTVAKLCTGIVLRINDELAFLIDVAPSPCDTHRSEPVSEVHGKVELRIDDPFAGCVNVPPLPAGTCECKPRRESAEALELAGHLEGCLETWM